MKRGSLFLFFFISFIGWNIFAGTLGQGICLEESDQKRNYEPQPHVTLQILDKTTGRIHVVEVKNQDPLAIGSLRVRVYRCHRSSLEEAPESVAYMHIWEEKQGQAPQEFFNGWMFSSSPAVSALDHPVYDVRLLQCHRCTTCCQEGR